MENVLLQEFTRLKGDPRGDGYRRNVRNELCKRYAWAVPNKKAIKICTAGGPLVEIGAGTGYWAALIAANGGDIVAYDESPYTNDWCGGEHFEVKKGGPEAAQRHKDRTLFLCWPPWNTSMATDALLAYEGKKVIYVGEGPYGCNGDDNFHNLFRDLYEESVEFEIPQWRGIYDRLSIWRRK